MGFQQPPQTSELVPSIKDWFDSPLGRELLSVEAQMLENVLPTLFGYHLLQIGVDSRQKMFEASPVPHRVLLGPTLELGMDRRSIVAMNDELPIQNSVIDVVILHHALDFAVNPHQVLREASRVLRPGGHLVILGFNPASLWGLYRRVFARRRRIPWLGHFIGHGRLQDWLSLLQMTETRADSGFYLPPFENPRWRARCGWMRYCAQRAPAKSGAVLMVVARKDVAGMIPLRKAWRPKLINLPVIEPKPSARG